ncbi:N-acetylglucosamine-6-phosphate deacetylase [Deinococcus yavapaiensis]|uniref:N-acetylglucosamine 6-phosphate deacetylase n=1 Tax=Deinococcus yavapaiensis KR-236 TaxID=694435 RepID=A0A318SGP8_9DEIO|nr:N-acetylglucosamine-6-phosphate deacetylase [Deinococcus yavapaiensis]PYE49444.1 N-acetylglucosamine 6-phosphate deacetylase [Deinococcus yavapaiensis KR-236]
MESFWIENVRVVTDEGIVERGAVQVREGRIEAIVETNAPAQSSAYDGRGALLMPGMIDVHIHGANGRDMMDGTTSSIEEVSRACASTGCTSFLVTSVSSSLEDLLRLVDGVRVVVGREPGATIVGIHAEGPYLNARRKGMQNELYLRHPDLAEMERVLQHAGSLLRMVTLAPELPGGLELTRYLRDRNVIVAVAHSDATYEEAAQAFACGASHVTHCFNGMRPIHHRDPGLVVAALENDGVSVQAIVDHVHLHPAIVRLMYRVKGASGMVLITDALQAMGLGDGEYMFGGHKVTVRDGVARLDDGTLASSTVTMNEALRNTVRLGVPLSDAVKMATSTPAELLGLHSKGRIAVGADADLVLVNDEFEVLWTLVEGRTVHGGANSTFQRATGA